MAHRWFDYASSAAPTRFTGTGSDVPRPGQRPRLHISSLPASWGNAEASAYFSKFGTITDVIVFREPGSGRSRYGFVELSTMDEATEAKTKTDGFEVEGALLCVKFAAPKAGGAQYGPGTTNIPPEQAATQARLFVGNIGAGTTTEQVKAEFEPFGKLTECLLWINHKASSRRAAGEEALSAFVQYENQADARAAKEALHGKTILRGRELELSEKNPDFVTTPPLIVDYSKPRGPPPARGGSGGYQSSQSRGSYGGGYDDRRYDDRRGYDDRSRGGYDRYDDRGSSSYGRGYDDRSRSGYDDRRYDDRGYGGSSSAYAASSGGRSGYYDDRSSSRYPPSSSSSSYDPYGRSSRRSRSRSPQRRERSRSPRSQRR